MSILTPYREAGVKSFTVQNGEAIAVNPYPYNYDHSIYPSEEYAKFLHESADLPPLPTSGIPDGTVSIEEVEDGWQWLNNQGQWVDDDDHDESIFMKYETRIVLVPKALRKGEEEKPKPAHQVAVWKDGVRKVIEDGNTWQNEANSEWSTFVLELPRPQPEKTEQTAEGYAQSFFLGEIKSESDREEYNSIIKHYNAGAESQLAQYKERLLAELADSQCVEDNHGREIICNIMSIIQNS